MLAPAARLIVAGALCVTSWSIGAASLHAQPQPPEIPGLHGLVTLADDGRALPGVVVMVVAADGRVAAEAVTDTDGRYVVERLTPGRYELRVAITGFEPASAVVDIGGGIASRDFQLAVRTLSDRVDVSATAPTDVVAAPQLPGTLLDNLPLRSDSVLSLLPLLPGVIRGRDGRLRMNGGQPSQSGLQVSSASVTDPSTGDLAFEPPGDAVESVQFLANPYAAEHGRFSTGLAEIRTRQGGEDWAFTLNSFLPRFRSAPDRPLKFVGLSSFAPRLSVSGPIQAGRWHLAQSVQYRWVNNEVRIPSRPVTALESFDSYTRLDRTGVRGDRLTLALAVFPRDVDGLLLDAFTPPESTARFSQRGFNAGVSYSRAGSRWLATFLVNAKRYDVDLEGVSAQPAVMRPTGPTGRYFNDQSRDTTSLQLAGSVSRAAGSHLVKAGLDLLASGYSGTSASLPVEVRRVDGTLAERVTFGSPSTQRVTGADVGLFGQHEWRPVAWLTTEAGVRLDRDGTLGRVNVAPRGSFAVTLGSGGTTVFRGGAGRFVQRTPLNVGAFESFERRTVTRFDALEAPIDSDVMAHVLGPLETPSSVSWNVELNHQLTPPLLVRVNHLRRRGSDEFIVVPGADTLSLTSDGRSRYHETEVTIRYASDPLGELVFTYVRSKAEADLNAYDAYFGNLRAPLIRANAFARTASDAPNRFLVRGTLEVGHGIQVLPVLEVRDGFPYSLLDEAQQFVGPRHGGGRFPRLVTLDLQVQRRIQVWRWEPRVGLRIFNVLNRFTPRDVLANVDVAGAPIFDNSVPRWIGITLWFDR